LAFLLLYQSITIFQRKESEMVMDWVTATGLVSALAGVVGFDIVARCGNQTRQPLRAALPPRFHALAASDFRDNPEYASDYLQYRDNTLLNRPICVKIRHGSFLIPVY
jgi:hypothetical protein